MEPVKTVANPSLCHILCNKFHLHLYWDCIFSLAFFFWPVHFQNPHLVFFTSLAKSHYICALAFVILSLHVWAKSLYLSRLHVPVSTGCAFLSYSSVCGTDPCSSNCTGFQFALLDFLNIRMEGSRAPRKVSLKTCQLLSAALSLRIICQGISPANYLSSWDSTLPKLRVLTLLFACVPQDHELSKGVVTTAQTARALSPLMSTSCMKKSRKVKAKN